MSENLIKFHINKDVVKIARTKRLRNEVKVALENYITVLLGTRKTGKTTLFRDLVFDHYNGAMEKGLLLGFEKGYQALDGIIAEDIFNWEDFELIKKEVIGDKKADLMGFPHTYDDGSPVDIPALMAFDTIDEFVLMAEKYTIKELNKTSEKKAKTINQAGGGYGRGKAYCKRIIIDAIQDLVKAGIGIVFIGHSKYKNRKIGEGGEGNEYLQLSCSLTDDYTDIFLDKADMIVFLKESKTINQETKTATSKVEMHFRSSGEIDCGSRFKGMPDKTDWGSKIFLEVFEKGVKASMLQPKTDSEIQKMKQDQKVESDKKAMENIEKMNQTPVADLLPLIKNAMGSATDDQSLEVSQVIKKQAEECETAWTNLDDAQESDREYILKLCDILSIKYN